MNRASAVSKHVLPWSSSQCDENGFEDFFEQSEWIFSSHEEENGRKNDDGVDEETDDDGGLRMRKGYV